MDTPTTVVIGAGRVGRTVAARLRGARLVGRGGRADLTGCSLLLIATPDAQIEPVCRALAPDLPADAGVVHFSGATSVRALDAASGPTACVHPLQTVWPELGPDQLEGAYAAVTGDQALGARLAADLGMTPFPLADEVKPVYHAAWLASRLGLSIVKPLTPLSTPVSGRHRASSRPGPEPMHRGLTATLREGRHGKAQG